MIKLAFSTLPCEEWEMERLIAFGTENGFTGIELREGLLGMDAKLPADQRFRFVSLFKEAGLTVTNIGSSVCIRGSNREQVESSLRELEASCRLASDLGAKGIRIFLGNFARRKDAGKEAVDYGLVVEGVRACCDVARAFDTEIWIETHNEFSTGQSLHRLLADTDKPNCKVIWDILHPLEDEETPDETIRYLLQACAHVHIKDAMPFDDPNEHDWKYMPIGKGEVPIAEIVRLLKRNGYTGHYSLEWETKWRTELQIPGSKAELVFPHYAAYMRNLFEEIDANER